MARDFLVTVHDPEQRAIFMRVLGTDQVCVLSPTPERANLPGKPDTLIYLMDLDQLSVQQISAMVQHLAQKFGLSVAEVERDIGETGVPIIAEHCSVIIRHPQRWLG